MATCAHRARVSDNAPFSPLEPEEHNQPPTARCGGCRRGGGRRGSCGRGRPGSPRPSLPRPPPPAITSIVACIGGCGSPHRPGRPSPAAAPPSPHPGRRRGYPRRGSPLPNGGTDPRSRGGSVRSHGLTSTGGEVAGRDRGIGDKCGRWSLAVSVERPQMRPPPWRSRLSVYEHPTIVYDATRCASAMAH